MTFIRVRFWFFLLLLLFLSGCAVKFVYNQLDWLIPWYLDDYVTLTAQQESMLDVRLADYLRWHRREQLPAYAGFLESIADASRNGLDATEIDHFQRRAEGFSNQALERLAVDLIDLFAVLERPQIEEMFEEFERRNDRYVSRFIDEPEWLQRDKRARDMQSFIERWTGGLEDDQIAIIEDWSLRYQLMGKEFLQTRIEWQQQLRQILERRADREYLQQAIPGLFSRRERIRLPAHQAKYRGNELLMKQMLIAVDRSLSGSQRHRMAKRLYAYAADFRELAVESADPCLSC